MQRLGSWDGRAVCLPPLCACSLSTASAQIKHGWLQRGEQSSRFMRRSLTAHSSTLPARRGRKNEGKGEPMHLNAFLPRHARRSLTVTVMLLGQKGEEGDKPLRQVHLKVLRNCQVNCAMHARATGAVGSCARRSLAVTAAALVGDYTKLCSLSTVLQTQLQNRADKRLKIKWHRAVQNLEKPAPKRTESRQRLPLTLTYLAAFDPFRCRINLQRDKPFLCPKSSPGWWLLLLFFVRNYKRARDRGRDDVSRPI